MKSLKSKTDIYFSVSTLVMCSLMYPISSRNVGPQVDPGKSNWRPLKQINIISDNAFVNFMFYSSRSWYQTNVAQISGVFVITHIDSCRNGAGYCILGYSCEVDKDFTKDDLGGHCRGLSKAFNPRASFVCCRENPKTNEANKGPTTLQHIIDAGYSENQSNIKTRLENKKYIMYKNIAFYQHWININYIKHQH